MNILLLGYGKMGKIIGEIAESRGHIIAGKINIDNKEDLIRNLGRVEKFKLCLKREFENVGID